MNRRFALLITLAILVAGMLSFAIRVERVEAEPGIIYIRENGWIDPPSFSSKYGGQIDNETAPFTLVNNITGMEIVVEKDGILFNGAGYGLYGPGYCGIYAYNKTIEIMDVRIGDYNTWGISLERCNYSNIHGNTITNTGSGGVLLSSYCSNNDIHENTMTNNGNYGIQLYWYCSHNRIYENTITNNTEGIALRVGSSYNEMTENIIEQANYAGIRLRTDNNMISGNTITNCSDYGILIEYSSYNTVSGNTITDVVDHGIDLTSCSNSSVTGNTITNNTYGIYFNNSHNSTLTRNNMTENGAGIYFWTSSDNNMSENDIANNDNGIYLFGYSSENTISGNNITANNYRGILLEDYCTDNVISGNNITDNGAGVSFNASASNIVFENTITDNDYGITFGGYVAYSSDNLIYHNNFINNTEQVFSIPGVPWPANFWDDGYPSGGNYWSDYMGVDLFSGPYQNETGSDGIGDTPYIIAPDNQDNYPLTHRIWLIEYTKPPYPDFAPSGMPDFDQRQWGTYNWTDTGGAWSHCGPVACANSIWWLDSKFEPDSTPPPTASDGFALLQVYGTVWWDDHDPRNVQPLVEHLAWLMDCDGRRTGQTWMGTYPEDMQAGLAQYLSWSGVNPLGDINGDCVVNQTDVDIVNAAMGSTPGSPSWDLNADIFPATTTYPPTTDNIVNASDLALVNDHLGERGVFYVHNKSGYEDPDFFSFIAEEVKKCQDVVLLLGFYDEGTDSRVGGHYVTVAGVDSARLELLVSNPIRDDFEAGNTLGRSPVPHWHPPPEPPYITHNNASLVSQDAFNATLTPSPSGYPWLLQEYFAPGEGLEARIEHAIVTSPLRPINERPIAAIDVDKVNPNVNETVTFDGSGSTDDGRIDYYFFDFGDGTNSGWTPLSVVTHQYASEGTYIATLMVMDDFGVQSINPANVTITVAEELPQLSVSLTINPTSIISEGHVVIEVRVTNVTNMVEGASVQLVSDKGGTFSPASGFTDSNGDFEATFTAPTVTELTDVRITATASKSGYADGSDYEYLSVLPEDIVSLFVTVTADQTAVQSGQTSTVTVQVTDGINPIEDASVTLLLEGDGSLTPASGQTNSSGYFTSTYTAPTVTAQTIITITATASKAGYLDGQDQTQITVSAPTLSVSVAADPTAIQSGQTSTITIQVMFEGNPISGVSVTFSSDGGGTFSQTTGTTDSDGLFTTTFTAPSVTTQTTVTITANAEKTGYLDGLGQTQITVNPSQSTPSFLPDQLWLYLILLIFILAVFGGGIAIARRKRHKPRAP